MVKLNEDMYYISKDGKKGGIIAIHSDNKNLTFFDNSDDSGKSDKDYSIDDFIKEFELASPKIQKKMMGWR